MIKIDDIVFLEEQIIASLLIDDNTHKYISNLNEELFSNDFTKKVFKIIKKLFVEKQQINVISVNNKISPGNKNNNFLEKLIKLTDELFSTASFKANVFKLKDIYNRKRLKNILIKTNNELRNNEISITSIKNELIKEINEINEDNKNLNSKNIEDIFINTLTDIENKKNNGEDFSYFTGFFELDKLTDGLHESELTCIGARPGTGKTAFALNIAKNIASKNKNVYFLSLEMSDEQIMQRIIANFSNINSQYLRTGRILEEEMIKIADSTNDILNLKMNIDSKTKYIEDFESILINLKNTNKVDLAIIDYLTLLKSHSKFQIREQEVAEITRKLKLLALDLKIPIIILVQLNRDAENKVPSLANIRESGSIEQNCDNVIFLFNENSEEKKAVEIIDVILEKQRQGLTGRLKLKFDKKYSRFSNLI